MIYDVILHKGMISNRVKRNVWLVLAVMSVGAVVDRAIRVAEGTVEWGNLVSAIVITAFCVKFYRCYRREVKNGNLFGRSGK